MHKKLCLLTVVLLTLLSQTAFARHDDDDDNEDHHKARRSEFGLNYPISNTSFFYRYKEFNSNYVSNDTSFELKVKSKGGFGFSLGGFVPIIPGHSKTNMLALDISGSMNILTWDMASISDNNFDDGSVFYEDGITSSTIVVNFMFGFEYKYGCDANLDKSQKVCFSFGGGVTPMLSITQFGGIPAGAQYNTRPYAKVEFGTMAGICMKLRATYVFGDIDYISYNDKSSTYQESLYMTNKSGLTLSLVLMPTSFKWEKKDKWDR